MLVSKYECFLDCYELSTLSVKLLYNRCDTAVEVVVSEASGHRIEATPKRVNLITQIQIDITVITTLVSAI